VITAPGGPDAVELRDVPEPVPRSGQVLVDVGTRALSSRICSDSLRSLAREGQLVVLGFTARQIPTDEVNRLLLINTMVMGTASLEFWRTEPGSVGQQWRDLQTLLQSAVIDPPIGSISSLEETAAVIRELDQRRAVGRILIRVRDRGAHDGATTRGPAVTSH
jgi:NADPH2:quinone reductase